MSIAESGNDKLGRDPTLARLYAAASAQAHEEPPAELDAAIMASARREVHAGPQSQAGPARYPGVRRNWYVPMSVAAVLVLSVSLVTLMRHEKGEESYQPPANEQAVPPAGAPDATLAPQRKEGGQADKPPASSAAAPAAERAVAKEESHLRAGAARKPERVERGDARVAPPPVTGKADELAQAKPSLSGKPLARADSSADAGRVGDSEKIAAEQAPLSAPSAEAPMAAKRPRPPVLQPQPLPGASEREVPRESKAEAQRLRRQLEGTLAEPAPGVQRAPAAEEVGRARAVAPVAPELRSPAKSAPTSSTPRPVWLVELENAPAEKWLERLAKMRRDGRDSEAEALLSEFRRRFPDHPASR